MRRAIDPPAMCIDMAPRDFTDLILNQARDIILIVGLDGKILYANQSAADAYGFLPDELTALTITDLRAPETHSLVGIQLQFAEEQGTLFRSLHRRKNGEIFPVEVSSRRFQLADATAVISLIRDITSTVEAETALRESEQKYQKSSEELSAANQELIATNEELTAMNEELTATDEILRSQFSDLLQKETEIRQQNLILTSLHETVTGLMNSRDSHELLSLILADATKLADTPHGFIYILDKSAQVFRRTHGAGIYENDVGREIGIDKGIVGQVYRTKRNVVVNDYAEWLAQNPRSFSHPEITAVLQVPLKAESLVIGTIGLAYSDSAKSFGPSELDILTRFAAMASLALDNASLLASYRQEIQEHKLTELALQNAQAGKQALINAIPDMMFTLDRSGVFLSYKSSADPLLLPPEVFLGKPVIELFPPALADLIMVHLSKAFDAKEVQHFNYEIFRNDQTEYYEARISIINDNEALAICRNVTERFLMEEQLKHLSLHDALTGCYNRAFFEEEMRRIERGRDLSAGLLICDVDGLKIINDSLGHATGDEVLKKVAAILADSFRAGDLISRIGGDEFAVLLATNSVRVLEQAKRRIRRQLEENNAQNPTLPISLSVGFAVATAGSAGVIDMTALFKDADNNMYREKLHQKNSACSAIVQGLIKALEVRDYITEGHGDRLTKLIETFARQLGLPEQKYPDLRLFAHFHDIGKVGIPDRILFKPARLTSEEWNVMRQHCEIGHRIASSTPDLAPIAHLIMRHQEWWDGGGYPLGLKGESIPLECRILSIIDAYDAMTHDRPYRKATTPLMAMEEIRRCAGTQFDPQLVDEFSKMLNGAAH